MHMISSAIDNQEMPTKRKVNEGEDSSSLRIVDEFSKLLKIRIKYMDDDRVSCAIFLLVNAARIWWEATKVTINVQTLTWKDFKDLFYDKYFPSDVRTQKVKEFLELNQGNMNLDDYILKFEEGCLFVHYIAENDKDRGDHIVRGARLEEGWKGGFIGKGKVEHGSKTLAALVEAQKPLCPSCGKPHKGECMIGSNNCFKCGRAGHIARFRSPITRKEKAKGCIFTMTKEDINPNSSVISRDEIYPTSVVRACSVQVNERTIFADLIVIPMVAFDVILGMDWLSTYHAVIDCVAKTMRFMTESNAGGLNSSSDTSSVLPFISCFESSKDVV
ncbi:uncharacterized protein LOC142541964 [Primulina tabacum]|uniref:uncharacterized protein LOC142541964 n=1 Tax=Primulina tabacum TaxID=48773 RepID=UPI003F5AD4D6